MLSVSVGDVAPVLMLLLYGLLPAQSRPGNPPGSDIELVIRAELGRVGALSGLWPGVSVISSSSRGSSCSSCSGWPRTMSTTCFLRPGMVRTSMTGVSRPCSTEKMS